MGIVDLHLQKRPKNIVMNFAYGSGFGIIRCDFLDILGKEAVKRDLMLGAVFDARGESIPEFASFRGRVRVAIRGDVTSTCRRCKVCGCYRYSAFGKRYVLAGALCNASIWESQDQSLIVGEDIIRRVTSEKWSELGIGKLPLLDEPQDRKPVFYSEEDGCIAL